MLLTIVITMFGLNSMIIGQELPSTAVKKAFKDATYLKESKLLVTLEDDTTSSLSKAIKSAIKEYWTFSEYEFIKSSDAKSYNDKEGYCFFSVFAQSYADSKDNKIHNYAYMIRSAIPDKYNAYYYSYFFLPGHAEKKDGPIKLYNYEYLLPIIVQVMNNQMEYDFKTNGKVPSDYKECRVGERKGLFINYFNNGKTKLPNMKIYICNDNVICEEKIKPYLAKYLKVAETSLFFANIAEITKIIAAQGENTAIFINGDIYSIKNPKMLLSSPFGSIYGECSTFGN